MKDATIWQSGLSISGRARKFAVRIYVMIAPGRLTRILMNYGIIKKILSVLVIIFLIIALSIHAKAKEGYEYIKLIKSDG